MSMHRYLWRRVTWVWVGIATGLTVPFISAQHAIAQPAPPSVTADSIEQQFDAAMADYDRATNIQSESPDRARQLFALCAQRLESIRADGIVNGHLEYNLGNAYLQAGDTGRAIVHYRRAQIDIPRDPHLARNLEIAQRRCLTYIPANRSQHVWRSIFFWHYRTSLSSRAYTTLATYIMAFALLTGFLVWRRRWMMWVAVMCFVVCVGSGSSVASHVYAQRHTPAGVILSSDVTVYRGPGTGYPRLFEQPLQSGVEFVLRERRGSWWRIELADGRSGWVSSETAEMIESMDGMSVQ